MLGSKSRVPTWESELWNYLSSGDGMRCPRYQHCQLRLGGESCPSDNLDLVSRLLDDRKFNIGKYHTLRSLGCCTVIRLVEKLAQSVIKKRGVRCLPVPAAVVFLADEHHPVEVRLIPLTAHHGAIWQLQEGWIIQLNENDTPARRRFTLFHEAFHVLAHRRGTPVFRRRDCKTGSFNELLADYFAACILMPREWVKEKWAEVKNLRSMAEIFDVEEPLMWIRLREMDLI